MSFRVSIVELIQELTPGFDVEGLLNGILYVFVATYLMCSIVLLGYRSDWDLGDAMMKSDFYKETNDCLYLSIAFSVAAILIGRFATSIYNTASTDESAEKEKSCGCFKCFYKCCDSSGRSDYKKLLSSSESSDLEEAKDASSYSSSVSYNSHSALDGGQPLLKASKSDEEEGDESNNDNSNSNNNRGSTSSASGGGGGRGADRSFGTAENVIVKVKVSEGYESETRAKAEAATLESDLRMNDTESKNKKREYWMCLLFICSTVSQIYLGIKCITFDFGDNQRRDGALMGLGVLWVNIIVWTVREQVTRASREMGEYLPLLHPHRLHLNIVVSGHYCDQCKQLISGGKAYRCNLCDFDFCLLCFAKRDRLNLEGQIRSDKGIKKDQGSGLTNTQYFWRSIKLIKTEQFLFLIAMFFLLLATSASLIAPILQGSILDSVVNTDRSRFQSLVKFYILISLASAVFSSSRGLCFNIIGRRLTNTIRKQLFDGIIVQDTAFFDGNHSGELSSRLNNDISFMTSPIKTMMSTLITNVILLAGGMAMCFYVSWKLSILAFTTVGPIIYITQTYAAWSQNLNREIYAALGKANSIVIEALQNIRLVKSVNSERSEQRKYSEAVRAALDKGVRDAIGGAGMFTLNMSLDLFASVLILWYGGILAMNNDDGMSAGKLITYQLYWNMMNGSYNALLDILTTLTRAGGAAQRVFGLIDSLPDIDLDAGDPLSIEKFKGSIELRNVSFAYQMRPDKQVLQNVSLMIPAGTTCALVGVSGGGKSTIVNLLLRFYDPHAGGIKLDGRDIREIKVRDLRRQIGVVQQNAELFQGSIEENITYGLEPGTWSPESVIEAAKKACAHDFIRGFPEGYSTRVGERGIRISGGQKQRIAIARAFLRKPRILLLDEATSALDTESEAQVQKALDNLMAEKGCTVILVAHRLSTVINADQICVVSDGIISESGSHDDLYGRKGAYFNLVQRQLKKKSEIVDADAAAAAAAAVAGKEEDDDKSV